MSFNLCADPLLLDLADPGQIVALSPYARDRELSPVAGRAARFPINSGSAEEVLALRPDLVLASGPGRSPMRDLFRAHGVKVVDVPPQEDVRGVEEAIAVVARATGHPERGRAETARFEARLRAAGPPAGRGRVAAYWQRRGYLTGTGTLIDDLFARTGLVNLARRLGRPALSQLSVEEMALARPDVLVLESGTARVSDLGTEMLHHPVLDSVVPPSRRIYIPQSWTVCGGPVYADAVQLLSRRLRALPPDPRAAPAGPPPRRAGAAAGQNRARTPA